MSTLDELLPALPGVARSAIAAALDGTSAPDPGGDARPAFAVFVTLRGADGALRGCVGSLAPVERDVVSRDGALRGARCAGRSSLLARHAGRAPAALD